ncbi:MAG TPA: VWA domain-containing protein [Solirubrobacteraceae bacterium]|nr:VWA domain-containing protein [Solirubrobacteraceae bacterium]
MSFVSPVWLLALALVPLAWAVYVWARRRPKRYVMRFPAAATVREVVSATPAWERHLPAALALAAIACLAVALARPRVTEHIPTNQANMMLVTDHSGSMAASDVQPTRLAAAVAAANTFIDQLPSTVRVGAIGFGSSADAVQGPAAKHAVARSLIDSLQANGGTDTGDALQLALQLLQGARPKHAPAAIVLLSDGAANAGPSPETVAQEAKKDHIAIYTVALGTPGGVLQSPDPFQPNVRVPPDPQLMQAIARISGGRAFNARSSGELSSIYKKLGSQLGSISRKHEITAWFAAAGVILLVGAGVASARFSGRLP